MKPYFLELSILSVRGVTFALTMKKSEQFTCQHVKKLMLGLLLAACSEGHNTKAAYVCEHDTTAIARMYQTMQATKR